jgi:hypothetical protein
MSCGVVQYDSNSIEYTDGLNLSSEVVVSCSLNLAPAIALLMNSRQKKESHIILYHHHIWTVTDDPAGLLISAHSDSKEHDSGEQLVYGLTEEEEGALCRFIFCYW